MYIVDVYLVFGNLKNYLIKLILKLKINIGLLLLRVGGFNALIGLHVVSHTAAALYLDVSAVDHEWGGNRDIPVVAD